MDDKDARIQELEAKLLVVERREHARLLTHVEELETEKGYERQERESLERRIQELEAEKRVFFDMKGHVKAERDRYEAALREIANAEEVAENTLPWYSDIARRALEGGNDG